ncbi:hypothetical protein [Phycicoccus flavus]|uniref:hypothetical protein n=1 Tax=Phycicoccus flavus TaxID=2502783 RepID=UPI000FEB7B01|nr:hypothetical protein [Phycicoccus flavus]NHA67888.1 hypothetical protein [Phycicoccus flavus]
MDQGEGAGGRGPTTTDEPRPQPPARRPPAWFWRPTPGLPDAGPRDRGTSDRVFGAVMVLLWVAWLVATTLTQPRLVTPDRFEADLAAGRVVAAQVVDLRSPGAGDATWSWSRTVVLDAVPDGGVDVSTGDTGSGGSGERAFAYRVGGVFAPLRIVDPSTSAEAPRALLDRVRAAGVGDGGAGGASWLPDRHANWPVWAAFPLTLMALGSIIAGPAPTRGTRWFWVWLVWVTMGVGVLAYALLEQLRPAPRRGEPGAPRRWTGVVGFLLMLLAGRLLAAAGTGLADSTHWLWLVRPG